MDAGRLDQIVVFQRRMKTPDGAGGQTEAWSDLPLNPRVWAHIGPKAGREVMNDGRMEAAYTVVFTIRNRTDIDETMRILCNDLAYNIRSIQWASPRELFLRIEAEKGVAP